MLYKYELGLTARDVVTGFEGVITGRGDYITGCKQYCLVSKEKKDGEPIGGQWFDEARLAVDHSIPQFNLQAEEGKEVPADVGGPQRDAPPAR